MNDDERFWRTGSRFRPLHKRLTPLTWIVLFICGLALFTLGVKGLAEAYIRAGAAHQSQVCAEAVDQVMRDHPGYSGIIICVPR